MDMIEKYGIAPSSCDNRKRVILHPVKILRATGDIARPELLLRPLPPQTPLSDPGSTLFHKGASILLDFGRELHGSFVIYNQGKAGRVRIRLGESAGEALAELGYKNAQNAHATRDRVFDLNALGSSRTDESGFRFVYIEMLSEGELMIPSVEAVLIYSDLEYIGSFTCSDPLVNRIYDTAAYTLHLNMQRYLWDGIKRDRLVWIGDMNIAILTSLALFGRTEIVPRSLDYVRDMTPPDAWMNGISSYSIWWILCQYDYYFATGDLTYLTSQKDYILALLRRLAGFIAPDGSEIMPEMRFIDWPNSANPEAIHAGLQGLLRLGMLRGKYIALVLGDAQTASICTQAATRLAQHHANPNGSKQAAALLALSGSANVTDMANLIMKNGANGFSTFLGLFTLEACSLAGKIPEALSLMREYWGGMLSLGATTFWEDFNLEWAKNARRLDEIPSDDGKVDIHGDFGAYCYVGYRHSLCHAWASGPVPFLVRNILGVKPTKPGYAEYKVTPKLGSLDYAEGKVPTPDGYISVRCEKRGDTTVTESERVKLR